VGSLLKSLAPSLSAIVEVSELLEAERPLAPGSASVDPSDPALIQYTSGSTGDPKGVLLRHENLLANVRAIGGVVRITPTDVGVSWLPLYHDMGLIGAWLTPLVYGFPVAIFSPLAFLARPERWLWTIHRRRGTVSPAPNFAYELAARKVQDADVEGLDLSSWRAALNGAEPVSEKTLDRFQKKFERHGFRRTSFLPVYGLAEASLLLAAPELGSGVRVEAFDRASFESSGEARPPSGDGLEPLRLVSLGRAIPGHEVRIVDERGEVVPERREGRLVFRGPSVTPGYYRNERATAAVLSEDGFFDSGDRAFFAEGELFVTGRAKDLIIKGGRNLIPQELEAAASEVPGVRAGSVVSFGVDDPSLGTERVVLVVETREEDEERRSRIASEVERRVAELVGVPPDDVLVVAPRTLPKTSSGKIRRSACRALYLRGELGRPPRPSARVTARLALFSALASMKRGRERSGRLLYGVYVTAITIAFVAPAWLLVVLGLPRRSLSALVRRASRLYLALAGIRYEAHGLDVLRGRPGPFIFVSNHASYLDAVPVMAAIGCDYAFVVKREAASWPVIGRFIRRLEHIPVERVDARESIASTDALKAALERGRSLVLFPEGTFTRADGIRPFKLGAFQLASECFVPVVPLALVGTRRWLRDGTLVPRRVPIRIEIGEPIEAARTSGEGSFSAALRLKEQAADAIARRVGEPRLDLPSAALEYP
jgi:1-acyl-sn-glycerol-3-phosphate acyltransferase